MLRTPLQPYVVATQSRGPACDAQSDAGCRGIHDEIPEPCMTPRNPPLGKFDRTTNITSPVARAPVSGRRSVTSAIGLYSAKPFRNLNPKSYCIWRPKPWFPNLI